jgi:type II secretion system protein H
MGESFPLRSRGFTLFEMLLVVGLVAVAAALAWPAAQRLYETHPLQQAAEQVRARLAWTRVHALQTGLAYQFRFEPGGSHFLAVPHLPENAEAADGVSLAMPPDSRFADSLPEGTCFAAVRCPLERLSSRSLRGLPEAETLRQIAWTPPVLFHPDGRATRAVVTVVDARRQSIALAVNVLTGGVTATGVQRESLP